MLNYEQLLKSFPHFMNFPEFKSWKCGFWCNVIEITLNPLSNKICLTDRNH